MSMFEVGKHYYISYGPVDEPSGTMVKVVAIDGNWMRVESDYVDPLINLASNFIHTAKEFEGIPTTSIYFPPMGPGSACAAE